MNAVVRGYPDVSQVLFLDPLRAAGAFDVMILDPALAEGDLIPAGALLRAQPAGYNYLRKLPATLRRPGRHARGLDVILELLPWSTSRSMLMIRTSARPHLLVERSTNAYLHAAERALGTLAELMDPRHLQADPGRRAEPAVRGGVPAQPDTRCAPEVDLPATG